MWWWKQVDVYLMEAIEAAGRAYLASLSHSGQVCTILYCTENVHWSTILYCTEIVRWSTILCCTQQSFTIFHCTTELHRTSILYWTKGATRTRKCDKNQTAAVERKAILTRKECCKNKSLQISKTDFASHFSTSMLNLFIACILFLWSFLLRWIEAPQKWKTVQHDFSATWMK